MEKGKILEGRGRFRPISFWYGKDIIKVPY